MTDIFRKCNDFKGFRKPTNRERAYIAKVVIKKYESPLLLVIIFLLLSLIIGILGLEWLAKLSDMGSVFGENTKKIIIVLGLFILICILELFRGNKLKKGKYEVLEGSATYYSYYSETSPHAPGGKKITYYHAIKDFISIHGEIDKMGFGQILCIPDYAHVNDGWGDGTDFPVLLIKVNGSVQHAIPDWEKVWQHPKYHQCLPQKRNIKY